MGPSSVSNSQPRPKNNPKDGLFCTFAYPVLYPEGTRSTWIRVEAVFKNVVVNLAFGTRRLETDGMALWRGPSLTPARSPPRTDGRLDARARIAESGSRRGLCTPPPRPTAALAVARGAATAPVRRGQALGSRIWGQNRFPGTFPAPKQYELVWKHHLMKRAAIL